MDLVLFLVILWLSSFSFSVLGILISYGMNTTIVNVLGILVVFPLAIIGGLWWPLEMMPSWIVSIGENLLTNKLLILSQEWIHSNQFNFGAFFSIILWIFGLLVVMMGVQMLFKNKESDIV